MNYITFSGAGTTRLRAKMRIVIIRPVNDEQPKRAGEPGRAPPGSVRHSTARTTSRALMGSSRELIIEHDGREYRLRVTQQGKLILTA